MADNQLTRQQIYDRIRETSKDEFILEEMKRLGFWGKKQGDPGVPELLIRQEAELHKELSKLWEQKRKFQQKEAALKEMRLKRMAEAKQKRLDTKKRKEQERFEKSEAWKNKKATEIIYLGDDVSARLNDTDDNLLKLNHNNLPFFENELALASSIGIQLKELSFLAFQRKVSEVNHYRKFCIPKKSGGQRMISAPMPRLKKVQYWILQNILNKVPLHQAANGFVAGRSIVTNATPHIGQYLVVNIDVKDFFPTIHFKRVKGLLQKLGYGGKIATILALLCTEALTDEVEIDLKNYFVQKTARVLPQGAPTSPAITNILCYKLDRRLQGLADKLNCNYTRYADDITFSGHRELNPQQMVWRIKKILQEEGFTVHPDKIRIMQKGSQQEVTGVVVNERLNVNRKKSRQFRALLHQLQTKPTETLHWGKGDLAASVIGYANFVNMVNPAKGALLQSTISRLLHDNILPTPVKTTAPLNDKKEIRPPENDGSTDAGNSDIPWWKVV